jgi:hypothetical protein
VQGGAPLSLFVIELCRKPAQIEGKAVAQHLGYWSELGVGDGHRRALD